MGWTEHVRTLQSRTLDSRRPVVRRSRSSGQASVANFGVWQKKISLLSSGSSKACTGKLHCAVPKLPAELCRHPIVGYKASLQPLSQPGLGDSKLTARLQPDAACIFQSAQSAVQHSACSLNSTWASSVISCRHCRPVILSGGRPC